MKNLRRSLTQELLNFSLNFTKKIRNFSYKNWSKTLGSKQREFLKKYRKSTTKTGLTISWNPRRSTLYKRARSSISSGTLTRNKKWSELQWERSITVSQVARSSNQSKTLSRINKMSKKSSTSLMDGTQAFELSSYWIKWILIVIFSIQCLITINWPTSASGTASTSHRKGNLSGSIILFGTSTKPCKVPTSGANLQNGEWGKPQFWRFWMNQSEKCPWEGKQGYRQTYLTWTSHLVSWYMTWNFSTSSEERDRF